MATRDINVYFIESRREAQHDFVAADDFTLSMAGTRQGGRLPPGVLPYCADMSRERVLFTRHDAAGLAKVCDAAFMFPVQLETAQGVVSVPFERLDEICPAPAAPPVLIFSPGRTGSTLLTRLLSAGGMVSLSEPDMLTQVARLERAAFDLLPAGTREHLAAACMAGLSQALGGGAVIKLRSQCNGRPLVLTQAAPGCRVVFMLRGGRGWAASRSRSFLEPPETVAAVLRQAVDALDKLAFAGADFTVLWFEQLVADPMAALAACAAGRPADEATIRAVMARDSQAGTNVARDLLCGAPLPEGFWEAFLACWEDARAGAEWHDSTRELLDIMLGM